MTSPDTKLQIKRFIKAEVTKVFAAWTKPDLMKQWFAPGTMTVAFAEADVRIGGRYSIQMKKDDGESNTTWGNYLEIIPQRKLVFTWGWEGEDRYETLVTVEFEEKKAGTEVTITHERFQNTEHTKMHTEGWNACLDSLEKHMGTF